MKFAICDDEQNILEEVKGYIDTFAKQMCVEVDIDCFQNLGDLVYEVNSGMQYDLVFFDIEIGNENGIHFAKELKEQHPTTRIAFITGHSQYIREVFDAQPCGFIDKPIKKEEVERVLKLVFKLNDSKVTFSYEIKGKRYSIYKDDICYAMSMGRKMILKTKIGEIIYYGTMNEEEKRLTEKSKNFIRIGQSVVVNRKYMVGINYKTIDLNYNGTIEQFTITQKYRERVKEWYKEELKWRM